MSLLNLEGYGVNIAVIFARHGAPLPNKTGYSGWCGSAAHDQPFENGFPANDPDFLVIDFDLIEHGTDIGPPERLAVDPVEAEVVRLMFKLFLKADGTSGPMGVKAVTCWLNEHGYSRT